VVVNRDWREGIASSIRAGVARLPASADAVLLLLVDQAALTAEDLRRLVSVWRRQPHCVVAAQYESVTGVPAIFPRSEFGNLTELRGDQGARMLLRRRSVDIVRVPLESAAVDIDSPEDLLRLGG
jgi:CTP:molybdopterin cytidylyltransferase MocA